MVGQHEIYCSIWKISESLEGTVKQITGVFSNNCWQIQFLVVEVLKLAYLNITKKALTVLVRKSLAIRNKNHN